MCLPFFPLPNPYIDLRPLHRGFLCEHHPLGGGRQHWGLITLGSLSPRFSSKKSLSSQVCLIIFPFHPHISSHFRAFHGSHPHPPHPPQPSSPIPHLYGSRFGGSRSHRHKGLVDHLKGQRLRRALRLRQHQGQGAAQLTQHLADA